MPDKTEVLREALEPYFDELEETPGQEVGRALGDLLRIAAAEGTDWRAVIAEGVEDYASNDLGSGRPSDQELEDLVSRINSLRGSRDLEAKG